MYRLSKAVAVGALAVGLCVQAHAAPIISDTFTVYNPPNVGGLEEQGFLIEGSEAGSGIGLSVPTNPALAGTGIVLLDPDGTISDIIFPQGNDLLAYSNPCAPACHIPLFPTYLPETSSPIDVTFMLSPELVIYGYTATFQSVDSTPEPLTLSLFGAGLVGTAVLRRRKKSAFPQFFGRKRA